MKEAWSRCEKLVTTTTSLCHIIRIKSFASIRVGLHHRPWSQIMEDDLFLWYDLAGQLSWSDFLTINLQSLWVFTRCKPNVDQEEWPCTEKWMCWIFGHMPKKRQYFFWKKIKFDHSLVFSCVYLLLLKNNFITKFTIKHFVPWAMTFSRSRLNMLSGNAALRGGHITF